MPDLMDSPSACPQSLGKRSALTTYPPRDSNAVFSSIALNPVLSWARSPLPSAVGSHLKLLIEAVASTTHSLLQLLKGRIMVERMKTKGNMEFEYRHLFRSKLRNYDSKNNYERFYQNLTRSPLWPNFLSMATQKARIIDSQEARMLASGGMSAVGKFTPEEQTLSNEERLLIDAEAERRQAE